MRSIMWAAISLSLALALGMRGVGADGIGLMHRIGEEEATDFSEDLQLVFIEANQTHQQTQLFVALKPLEAQSHDLTLAVPMLSPPLLVDGRKMGTEEFREVHGLRLAEQKANRRNLSFGLTNTASYLGFFRRRTAIHLLLPLSSMVTLNDVIRGYYYGYGDYWGAKGMLDERGGELPGIELVSSHDFDGITMNVYHFDDYPSLQELLRFLGLEPSESAEEEVDKYGAHYVSTMTMQLSPPVDPDSLEFLQTNCPQTLETFFQWLPRKDEEIRLWREVFGRYPDDPVMWATQHFVHLAIDELEEKASSTGSTPMGISVSLALKEAAEASVTDLVKGYMSYPEEGYRISFTHNHTGRLWYPLGTSSSWNHPIGLTEVLIQLDDGLWLEDVQPEPTGRFSTPSGRQFYWRMENQNPSEDLSAGIAVRLLKPPRLVVSNVFAVFLTGWYKAMAGVLNLSVYIVSWLVALLFAGVLVQNPQGHRFTRLVALAGGLSIVTFFLSFLPVVFAYPLPFLRRRRLYGKDEPDVRSDELHRGFDSLIPLLVSWAAFCALVFVFTLANQNPFLGLFFFVISGMWLLLISLVLGRTTLEWRGKENAKLWALAILFAFTILTSYSISMALGFAVITACLMVATLTRRHWKNIQSS